MNRYAEEPLLYTNKPIMKVKDNILYELRPASWLLSDFL